MGALNIYTIYDSPDDYPGFFVARLFNITPAGPQPKEIVAKDKALEEVRKALPPGLYCISRAEKDPPSVVESWL